MSKRIHLDEVLFEFHVEGRYVKVTAIDPQSQTEVSIVGDPRIGKASLQRTAIRKLEYVMQRGVDKGARKI